MTTNVAVWTRILLSEIKIFICSIPDCWTRAFKDERILKITLSGHDSVDSRLLYTSLYVSNAANISISENRNRETFADLLNDLPVSDACQGSFHFTRSSVNCDYLSTSLFQHLSVANRLLFILENSDFACHRHLEIFIECFHCRDECC